MYQIKLEQFEGPMTLLMSLIEEQKLDVTRLSLAKVTDQYLEYIENKQDISLENLADFLSVASKLILIKSKALLPLLELSNEEEKEIKDLEWQLVEYKKFKEASKKIDRMINLGRTSFSRDSFLGLRYFFRPPENINLFDIKKAFLKILSEIPIIEKLEEEMVRDVITLEEKITHLENSLREKIETSFSEIASTAQDKIEVIISFLAMLEMIKQRIINVNQKNLFQDIRIKLNEEAKA
jgi:segregation and condensation protein A